MTEASPPRASRFNASAWWFLLGLTIFGAFGFAMFTTGSGLPSGSAGLIAMALAMIGVTGAAALWAFRAGKVGLGSGLLIGYAVAALASGGQCTLLTGSSADYGFISGALIYLALTALALVVAIVALIVSLIMRRMGGPR